MKRWIFRMGAACLGLGGLFVLECLLRVVHVGQPDVREDSFVGFSDVRPLFELSEVGDYFETALSRTNYFVRDRFLVKKPPESFRAFFLGGSTVQGRPYAIETAFPKWVQLSLQASDPSRRWEMINCGGISYASYRLVSILEECLELYRPDLIVLCTGQNEYLEERTYGSIKHTSKAVQQLQAWAGSWHLYQVISQGVYWMRGIEKPARGGMAQTVRSILPEEVDAFLDYENGLEAYHWDPEWRKGVGEHFEQNIERMVRLCENAGVPMLILSPPVNLRSSLPFKSEHRADLSDADLDEWQRCIELAYRHYSTRPNESVEWLRKAIQIDPQFARTYYALGKIFEEMGRRSEARANFVQAKDRDVCPLRMLESERASLAQIALRHHVPFVDLHAFLEEQSDFLSLGSDLLVDHVHPSIKGHQLVAGEVVKAFVKEGWVKAGELELELGSESLKAVFQRHLDSLSPIYYLHGRMRLDNLTLWTKGRTGGLPLGLKPELVVE